jgi:hypothetical protein
MKSMLRIALVLALIAVAMAAVLRQRGAVDQLRRESARMEENIREGNRLRADNLRLAEILAQRKHDQPPPVPPAEFERAHQELAMWERRANELERTKAAGDIATNRDPEKGMVRLEHFRNVGRATPAAAIQTAIWAAAQADFDEVGKSMALSATGREKAQAYLNQQSVETRTRFDSPEKLVGVLFAHDFTNADGFQIVGSTTVADGRAVISLRRLQKNGVVRPNDRKVPFEPGADGWKMVVPDQAIDAIPDYVLGVSMEIPLPAKK